MKILVITPYKSMIGGANRSLLMVLKGLKNEYKQDLLVVVPAEGVFSEALKENGIAYTTAPIHEVGGVYGKGLKPFLRKVKLNLLAAKDRKGGKAFAKSLQEKFDLVYINDNSTYFGSVVARALKIPYVWHFRSLVNPDVYYNTDAFDAFEKCTRLIAISDGMQALIEQTRYVPKGKTVRIHNGIPLEDAEKSGQSRENGFHFIQCGRITPDKGQMDAITALGMLKEKGICDIYLHIVGAVPEGHAAYKESLEAKVKELGLEEQVIFEGTRNDLPFFRADMNGELMCSVCEPFGRVTLEGMRSGLVVIGSDTGGTPEIVTDNETGQLYRQGSAADLAEKIRMVYEDENLAKRLADAAYEFSRTHFTPETNVKAIFEVLEQAVKEK